MSPKKYSFACRQQMLSHFLGIKQAISITTVHTRQIFDEFY